jgi:hypothetical protein
MNKKIVNIGEKSIRLIYSDFGDDIEIDDLLKIDYHNLVGELITFPIIENRFGLLLADSESKVSENKLNLEILEAKLKEQIREKILDDTGKAPTVEALNNAVTCNKAWQVMKRNLITAQKTRDYMNSIFWAAKDKSGKLEKLSQTVQLTEIPDNVLEGRINGILVKKNKNLMD